MRRRPGFASYATAIALACAALSAGIARASAMASSPVTLALNEQHVTDVWGTRIVYDDWSERGSDNISGRTIRVYDIATEASSTLVSSTAEVQGGRIYGDWVVYQQLPDKVYSLNLATGEERLLGTGLGGDVYGAYAVYTDTTKDAGDIMLCNLKTHSRKRITGSGTQSAPSIWGGTVAYQGTRSGNTDVYTYDISTHATRRITTSAYADENPKISGSIIAFGRTRKVNWSPNTDIYVYDRGTRKTTRATSEIHAETLEQVWGTRVLYTSGIYSSQELWLYDSLPAASWKLADTGYWGAALWDNVVAWTDMRNTTQAGEDTDPFNRDAYWGRLNVPFINLKLNARPQRGHKATFSAVLTKWNGPAFTTTVPILLQKSTNKKTWTTVSKVRTSSEGIATLKSGNVYRTTYFRVAHMGDYERMPSVSAVVTVKPR